MIGRREAFGLGVLAVAGIASRGDACTIIGYLPQDLRRQRAARVAIVKKFVTAVANDERAAMVVALGDGPWEFHGERVEQQADSAAISAIAKRLIPGSIVLRITNAVALEDRVFATVWGRYLNAEVQVDDCPGDGSELHYLSFSFAGFSNQIYGVEKV